MFEDITRSKNSAEPLSAVLRGSSPKEACTNYEKLEDGCQKVPPPTSNPDSNAMDLISMLLLLAINICLILNIMVLRDLTDAIREETAVQKVLFEFGE